ncbi:fucolectin-6-like [Ruditapes philippinarum]|uniref:fucolectin-6-like n=1 Tax=Ruditapes philippinarum TaxID=129788 RepID=UPI00295AD0BA|nr:fucolectin-6-like [Ruditapes philippinarum]
MFAQSRRNFLILSCYFGVIEQHVLVNLALNKNARQSDVQGGRYAALAVDGGLSQHMGDNSCTHTTARADAFWEVDLGRAYFIDHVIIYNRADCCSNRLREVELYIGLKTETYKQYGFHEGVVGPTYTFQLENVALGRWVRITTIPSVIDYLTLCEVQVFGYVNFQYFDIKSNWSGNGNKTTVQTSTAIQCAYICYKTKECEEANFDNYKHLCDM